MLIPILGAVASVVSSDNQRKAAEAQAKARKKELEMQIAAVKSQQEQQQEMLKQVAVYGGIGLVGLMVLRGLMR